VNVELAHGVDDPHGGLAAIDDGKAEEPALHRSAAHDRAGRGPGMVRGEAEHGVFAEHAGQLNAGLLAAPAAHEPRRDGRAHGP
jgi:hypothetical protein